MMLDTLGHEEMLCSALGIALQRWGEVAAQCRKAGNYEVEAQYLRFIAEGLDMAEQISEMTDDRFSV